MILLPNNPPSASLTLLMIHYLGRITPFENQACMYIESVYVPFESDFRSTSEREGMGRVSIKQSLVCDSGTRFEP